MRLAITGSGGLLGKAVTRRLESVADVVKWDWRSLMTISDERARQLFTQSEPQWVINCAAHTDVEGAERDAFNDYQGNVILPARLAQLCARHSARMVNISSTGCYGNWQDLAYIESDPVSPTTVHHKNKVAGEQAITESGCRHLILRTGWLYGGDPGAPKNFVWKRMIEGLTSSSILSDSRQFGVPTSCLELADQMLILLEHDAEGLFNATAHGSASRFDYVAAIVRLANLPCHVEPGPAFQRLANVSHNEMALNARLGALSLDIMKDWTVGLGDYVQSLTQSSEWQAVRVAHGLQSDRL